MRSLVYILISFFLIAPGAGFADEHVQVSARKGVTQPFLWMGQDRAVATVILFAGGTGRIELNASGDIGKGSNFLVRTRDKFYSHGFNVIVVDAPSDHYDSNGMLYGFRHSKEHVQDVAAIIAEARKRSGVPVWLIGTSRGTESAANAAVRLDRLYDGVIFTAAITVSNDKGMAITEHELGVIRTPVLIASHEEDACYVTPPSGSQSIQSGLVNATRVSVRMYRGGKEPISDACQAESEHGFYGIETEVVDDIANFIKQSL